jgi:hypothetical protein
MFVASLPKLSITASRPQALERFIPSNSPALTLLFLPLTTGSSSSLSGLTLSCCMLGVSIDKD